MMADSIRRSRSAIPISDRPRGGAMGTWGLWCTLIVLAMFIAGLAAAAFYLETARPAPTATDLDAGWPPAGIEIPGLGLAGLALALVVGGAVATMRSRARLLAGDGRASALALALATTSWTGAVLVLVADLANAPFRWDEHAATSVYWVHTGITILFVGVAVLMAAAVLTQLLTGVVDRERHLELVNTVIYGWFAVGAAVVLLGLVHLLPRVAGG
jgi:heme/copper-type cytochrome/quinol oxidase subunit 3